MRVFLIVIKIIFSIFGVIWNAIVGIINGLISLINSHIRKKNDQISRGVTEIKQSNYDQLLPAGSNAENMIITGANKLIRANWIAQITANSYAQGYPVIIIHGGNDYLKNALMSKISSSSLDFIDENTPLYEPFYKQTSKEISKFLIDSATTDYDLKKNAMYYINGMCDFLHYKKIKPTLSSFNKCPHMHLFDKIDGLVLNGSITDVQGQEIKSKLMMGQSEQIKIEALISDLYDQFAPILNRTKNNYKNINVAITNRNILSIDINTSMNELLLNYLLTQIRYFFTKGQDVMLITDGLSASTNEKFKRLLQSKNNKCKLVICDEDVYSMCASDEKLFGTLVGNCEYVVILGHSSGATCTKLAETIGYYDKQEESQTFEKGRQRHSPFSLFPGSNTSTSKSYSMKREYIVKPEKINRMVNNEVYFYNHLSNKLVHTYVV